MKVLALPRYARQGASSRVRFFQFLPWLAREGVEVTVAPLFSDEYVARIQQGSRSQFGVAKALAHRAKVLMGADRFDLVWAEKDLLPWLPAIVELSLMPRHLPLVLDYDDAVFHQYELHPLALVRWVLGNKHNSLMQRASAVVAGNAYLANYANKSGARRVEVIPTVVDLERYKVPADTSRARNTLLRVGWIGQSATAAFLKPLNPVMTRLHAEGLAEFVAIGIDAQALGLSMESCPWSEAAEVAELAKLDVGVMPLPDEPFERGKCGYKLIQYMACGLPVVASPVGANLQIVEHGVNGFLASTPDEWESALRQLAADAHLRASMGRAGRQKIVREYSLQACGPRMIELLKSFQKS